MRRGVATAVVTAAVSLAAVWALAGCGGSDKDNQSSAAGSQKKFMQCMQEHGLARPQSGERPDPSKMQDAFKACAKYAPKGGPGGGAFPGGAPPDGAPPGGASPGGTPGDGSGSTPGA